MKLINSIQIEKYVEENKKEAENEFPSIIKRLIKNTVENITDIHIPSGNNTMQIGVDGYVSFKGKNKYLGDKTANIEIGTSKNYIDKANKDIRKRTPKKDENFIFITPYRWNNRKKSKLDWIREKKIEFHWNEIKVIDASDLEDWLEEDFLTTKFFMTKINEKMNDVYTILEKEEELKLKTIKELNLNFFDYQDNGYEKLLGNLTKDYYNILAPTREEGIYVTLYYLKKLEFENVLIVENNDTWNELTRNNFIKNAVLIPNFYHNEELIIPKNNVTLLIYDNEEFLKNIDYVIKERTVNNLNESLGQFYLDETGQKDHDVIQNVINKSLGKYMPLKREIFKELKTPTWYSDIKNNLYLYLFFINDFKSRDFTLFEEFGIAEKDLKENLMKMTKEKDPFIVYYKYWDRYKVVNVYNAIDWLHSCIDKESVEQFCSIAKKVLFYIEPKYSSENINKLYFVEDSSLRKYSKEVKGGILKGLIITKLYLQKENIGSLYCKIDNLIDEYYLSINTESEFLNFANIANKLVEINYEKFLNKIKESVGNVNFNKMFNLENKDTLFSSNEYCNILWGLEKAMHKKEYARDVIEILFLLCEIKNANYKNMAKTPFNTLKSIFLGWDNLTCLTLEEKEYFLKLNIENHYDIAKKLLQSLFPTKNCMWSYMQKPEYDTYDQIRSIKYVNEQKEFFEKYYELYVDNCVSCLDDLVYIYSETYFIDFNCFEKIKNKTLELITVSNDEEKFKLKEEISEKLRGFEKFHNSAWNLTKKQLGFLTNIKGKLVYENSIYDYIFLYKYRVFIDDEQLIELRIDAMNLLKVNEGNEDLLLTKCDNKRALLHDIYNYRDNKKCNKLFLKKLFKYYNDFVESYLQMIYRNEPVTNIIDIYNSAEIKDIPIEDRIFILSNYGYNEELYKIIKNSNEEAIYWKKLDMYCGDNNDFVYDMCLQYENYEMCLNIISEQPDKYDKKCALLEKIKDKGITSSSIDDYKIQQIFKGFYNYNKIDNFERLTKLEIYFSPILENKTYFLSKQASKSPEVVAELVEIIYKDDNGNSLEIHNKEMVVSNCFDKLHDLEIDFDNIDANEWCDKFIKILREKNRTKVMYHILGQLLARTGIDKEDKIYPTKSVRLMIEKYNSKELSNSFRIERYNQRGIHNIDEGQGEYQLYKCYLEWYNQLKIKYPKTAKILKELADEYRKESIALRDESNYV